MIVVRRDCCKKKVSLFQKIERSIGSRFLFFLPLWIEFIHHFLLAQSLRDLLEPSKPKNTGYRLQTGRTKEQHFLDSIVDLAIAPSIKSILSPSPSLQTMADEDFPIDINYAKITDWLVSLVSAFENE